MGKNKGTHFEGPVKVGDDHEFVGVVDSTVTAGEYLILGSDGQLLGTGTTGIRSISNKAGIGSTLYVETTGSDTTGDGTFALPYATILRAVQDIGTLNSSTITIQCGAGEFVLPAMISNFNWITVLGEHSIEESRTINTVDTLSDADGIAITVDGAALANDDWRGRMIQWTSGGANNDYGIVYRNTGNQLFVTNEDPSSLPTISAGNTFDLISEDTSLSYGTISTFSPVIQNCVQLNIQKCKITDDLANGCTLFVLDTDKVQFRYCSFDINRIQAGGFGRVDLGCCLIATKGGSSRGVLTVRNESNLILNKGTVIDCGLNTSLANKRFIQFTIGSRITYYGMVVIRQIDDAKGIQCDGSNWSADGNIGTHSTLRFETEGASPSCIAGFVVNGQGEGIGGVMQLPNLHGEVTSNYGIVAEEGAEIVIGASSTLTTATVTNAASADAGTSASASNRDGTIIRGGDPIPTAYHATQTLAAGAAIDPSWERINVEGSGGAVTLTSTPNITAGNDGETLIIKGVNNTNTLTIQDESQLGSSGVLTKTGTNVTLTQGDVFQCTYSSTDSAWIEL